jgi:hypothetical protein
MPKLSHDPSPITMCTNAFDGASGTGGNREGKAKGIEADLVSIMCSRCIG